MQHNELSADADTSAATVNLSPAPAAADSSGGIPDTLPSARSDSSGPTRITSKPAVPQDSAASAPDIHTPGQAIPSDTSDSMRTVLRDSLWAKEGLRRKLFYPDPEPPRNNEHFATDVLFSSDATSWYDVVRLRRKTVAVRRTIAGSYNRFLLYGNTAPVTRNYYGSRLIYNTDMSPVFSEDAVFTSEYRGLTVDGNDRLYYHPHGNTLMSPEVAILWETGVFDENILSLRFSRPVSRRLFLNVYSNYRHFQGKRFDHDGNNVYSFYSSVSQDTSLLSHRGYNPLVDEYYCGADATWRGKAVDGYARIHYGDLSDELPIDRAPRERNLEYSLLSRYPLSIFSSFASRITSPLFFITEIEHSSHPLQWTRSVIREDSTVLGGVTDVTRQYVPTRTKIDIATTTGAFSIGARYAADDSISVRGDIRRKKLDIPDSLSMTSWQVRPEVYWSHRLSLFSLLVDATAGAGYDLFSSDEPLEYNPFVYGKLKTSLNRYTVNLSIERDYLHYSPLFDSLALENTLHDAYLRTGIELQRSWRLVDIMVGYQWCSEIDSQVIKRSWFNGTVPYRQPRSVFIIAPEIGPWHGMTLSSRCMASDTKPYIKLQSTLSFHLFPKLTHEAFDIRCGVDYWSSRDPLSFADTSDWNHSVLDVNFAATAHIKSFRLIYKVDNLLNRKNSYIPGFYSPGITFRWGFAWFIQR